MKTKKQKHRKKNRHNSKRLNKKIIRIIRGRYRGGNIFNKFLDTAKNIGIGTLKNLAATHGTPPINNV